MPTSPTYPGVYIEEIDSGVRTITGVSTSTAAFVGSAERGPVNEPVSIGSFGDYERTFGRLVLRHPMGFAVRDFFLNGGASAVIVRLVNEPADPAGEGGPTGAKKGAVEAPPPKPPAAEIRLPVSGGAASDALVLVASSPGAWGNNLQAVVDRATKDGGKTSKLFNLTISETGDDGSVKQSERHLNLSIDESDSRFAPRVLEESSTLVRVARNANDTGWSMPGGLPSETFPTAGAPTGKAPPPPNKASGGLDGGQLKDSDFIGDDRRANKEGLFALAKADLFNLLCIPPYNNGDVGPAVLSEAAQYCEERRAMLLVDAPGSWRTAAAVLQNLDAFLSPRSANAALFFPRILAPNAALNNQITEFVPCGAIAGVFARTDAKRGVWKAPAGVDATLAGVLDLSVHLTDFENGQLNPMAVNCLRSFPAIGRVVWGSRTTKGTDILADDYKSIPVRRTALYIEESLFRGTKWVVFEPNDEPLWSQIRLNVGSFMHDLFRQGAFQGTTPRDAYFVKCDKETTTQRDRNLGIVNIVVGFAPLKPAEFVIIKLQQMAGQIEA